LLPSIHFLLATFSASKNLQLPVHIHGLHQTMLRVFAWCVLVRAVVAQEMVLAVAVVH
jgi:hypothetical protein